MQATRDDVSLRGVVWSAIALIVVTVAVYAIVGLLFSYFNARETRRSPRLYPLASTQPQLPPQPRLQADPALALKELRQRDEEILNGYGWVNEQSGIVRIPIERAMTLLLERGLPVRPSAPPTTPSSSPVAGPQGGRPR